MVVVPFEAMIWQPVWSGSASVGDVPNELGNVLDFRTSTLIGEPLQTPGVASFSSFLPAAPSFGSRRGGVRRSGSRASATSGPARCRARIGMAEKSNAMTDGERPARAGGLAASSRGSAVSARSGRARRGADGRLSRTAASRLHSERTHIGAIVAPRTQPVLLRGIYHDARFATLADVVDHYSARSITVASR